MPIPNLAILLLVLSMAVQGQQTASTQFEWSSETLTLTRDSAALTLHWNAPSAPRHFIAVRVAEQIAEERLSLVEVSPRLERTPGGPSRPIASSWKPGDRPSLNMVNGAIRIASPADSSAIQCLYIELRRPATLSIALGDDRPKEILATDGTTIRDGLVSVERIQGMHHMIALAAAQDSLRGVTRPGATGSGFTASIASLRKNLVKYVPPGSPTSTAKPLAGAMLQLQIDASGHVSDVGGPASSWLDASALARVRQWEFRPFEVNAKTVPVTARIIATVSAEGRLVTSLDPAAVVD